MDQKDYQCSFTVAATSVYVQQCIARVSDWWTASTEGASAKTGDVFTVHFSETWVTFEITQLTEGKNAAWLVKGSYLPWLRDKEEWTGTTVDWTLSESEGQTSVIMTHIGLQPGIECYESCRKGWNFFVGESLYRLITEEKGLPDTARKDRVGEQG